MNCLVVNKIGSMCSYIIPSHLSVVCSYITPSHLSVVCSYIIPSHLSVVCSYITPSHLSVVCSYITPSHLSVVCSYITPHICWWCVLPSPLTSVGSVFLHHPLTSVGGVFFHHPITYVGGVFLQQPNFRMVYFMTPMLSVATPSINNDHLLISPPWNLSCSTVSELQIMYYDALWNVSKSHSAEWGLWHIKGNFTDIWLTSVNDKV